MTRYLIPANVWLLLAFLLYAGRVTDRVSPLRYSFFGIGGGHSGLAYHFMILLAVLLAGFFFHLAWRTRPPGVAAPASPGQGVESSSAP